MGNTTTFQNYFFGKTRHRSVANSYVKNTAFHVAMIILSLCGFVILHLKCKLKNMTWSWFWQEIQTSSLKWKYNCHYHQLSKLHEIQNSSK